MSKRIDKLKKNIATGFYTLFILLILSRRNSSYGLEILNLIKKYSNGFFTPSESTIYSTLHKLEKGGYVISFWAESNNGPPRKYYKITKKGRHLLKEISDITEKVNETIKKLKNETV